MNILITGGAGFIGSHLCDYLINDNDITVIDNLSLGKLKNINHLFESANFKFIEGDILNDKLVDKIFNEKCFDIVFHMAANSDIAQSFHNPDIDNDNTFMTTYFILRKMKTYGIKKIVFASSSAIYGETSDILGENYGPLKPVSHYGAAKLASESFISSFVENYGFRAWIIRFPNVVGERATHGVIFDFINKLSRDKTKLEVLGNGEQYKPYLYVKDLVEAMLFILENSNDKLNIFNVGVETRTKVKEIAEMVIKEMNLTPVIEYSGGEKGWMGDVPVFNYDLKKINKLGWKAKNSSNEAVRKAIKYILALDA